MPRKRDKQSGNRSHQPVVLAKNRYRSAFMCEIRKSGTGNQEFWLTPVARHV